MRFSGIQKFTTIDFPETLACILFTPGCNFRCGYCYNSEFVLPEKLKVLQPDFIDESAVISFLTERKGLLEGVVISGGEPTIHHGLQEMIMRIRDLGFQLKLDTNGSNPKVVQDLLSKNLIDYIAIDIKASPSRYGDITGLQKNPVEEIQKSIEIVINSGVSHEFRSTLIKGFHKREDIPEMAKMISGAQRFYLQTFQTTGLQLLDKTFETFSAFTNKEMKEFADIANKYVQMVGVR